MRAPIKLTWHWRRQLYISLQIILMTYLDPWTETVTNYNNKPTRRKKGEKIAIEKNRKRKAIWKSKILKNKSWR